MSVITARSGATSLIARMARLPMFSGSQARSQPSVFRSGSECGKMQIAGMPRFIARSAARFAPSSVRRSTPGIEGISPSLPATSVTKIGQIRFWVETWRSAVSARRAGVRRSRRRRVAGKGAMMGVAGMGASCRDSGLLATTAPSRATGPACRRRVPVARVIGGFRGGDG